MLERVNLIVVHVIQLQSQSAFSPFTRSNRVIGSRSKGFSSITHLYSAFLSSVNWLQKWKVLLLLPLVCVHCSPSLPFLINVKLRSVRDYCRLLYTTSWNAGLSVHYPCCNLQFVANIAEVYKKI